VEDVKSLCAADHRVRKQIVHYLEKHAKIESSEGYVLNAAFQLAFCKKVGFGTLRDEDAALFWLHKSNRADLQEAIEKARIDKPIYNARVRKLYDDGQLLPASGGAEYFGMNDLETVEAECRREFKQIRDTFGKVHPAVINLRMSLMNLLKAERHHQLPEFIDDMREELERDPEYGPEHFQTLWCKSDLAMALLGRKEFERAEKHCKEAYDGAASSRGENHLQTLMLRVNLANIYFVSGKFAAGNEMIRMALRGFEDMFGENHPYTLLVLAIVGTQLEYQGRFKEAEDKTQRQLKAYERTLGNYAPQTLDSHMRLARLRWWCGKDAEAEEAIRQHLKAIEDLGAKTDPTHQAVKSDPSYLTLTHSLADTLGAQGKFEEAATVYKDLIETQKQVGKQNALGTELTQMPILPNIFPELEISPSAMINLISLAIVLQAQGKYEEAKATNRLVMDDLDQVLGKETWPEVDPKGRFHGSAIHSAMWRGYGRLVEILLETGAQNAGDGVYYQTAMDAAEEGNSTNIASILLEHQTLLRELQKDDDGFGREELSIFLDGDWQGYYFYSCWGGQRREKEGVVSFSLKSRNDPEHLDTLIIEANGTDDTGEFYIDGHTSTSGSVLLIKATERSAERIGWEYRGCVNVERSAMGGRWGFRNAKKSHGTFCFYKV
jgi:tetratricopeptide (TPR) repeat protein